MQADSPVFVEGESKDIKVASETPKIIFEEKLLDISSEDTKLSDSFNFDEPELKREDIFR